MESDDGHLNHKIHIWQFTTPKNNSVDNTQLHNIVLIDWQVIIQGLLVDMREK